jgi:hypothetical protein
LLVKLHKDKSKKNQQTCETNEDKKKNKTDLSSGEVPLPPVVPISDIQKKVKVNLSVFDSSSIFLT